MRSVFVDTSAWYALADTTDANHGDAETRFRDLLRRSRTFLTSNAVIGESYTLIRVRLGFSAATRFLSDLRASSIVERVFVPEDWEVAAEELLSRYEDQDFSYVDATSFVAMQRLGIREFFAYDHHFTVMGFSPVNGG